MRIESPPLGLPGTSETAKSVGLSIAKCRTGLTAAVGFILGRESRTGQDVPPLTP